MGSHRGRSARDFLWERLAGRAAKHMGSPIVGGLRATTAGCARTTRWSMWWHPPSLRRGVARARARISPAATPFRCSSRRRGSAQSSGARAGDPSCGVTPGSRFAFASRSEGPVRFISHRDIARAFERAFRIAQLPISFTQGFSPRPKVSFGPASAVGYESECEYLDLELADAVDADHVAHAVSNGLPEGIQVTGAVRTCRPGPGAPRSHHVARVPSHRHGRRCARDRRLQSPSSTPAPRFGSP